MVLHATPAVLKFASKAWAKGYQFGLLDYGYFWMGFFPRIKQGR